MSSTSTSDESDIEEEPKRRKREPMFYRQYHMKDGSVVLPRSTRKRFEQQLSNSKNNSQKPAPSSSGQIGSPTPKSDSADEPDNDCGTALMDIAAEGANSHITHEQRPTTSSVTGTSTSRLDEAAQRSTDHFVTSEADNNNSQDDAADQAQSSSASTSSEEDEDQFDVVPPNEPSGEEATPFELPTALSISLGNLEYLKKKYRLDEPVFPKAIETSKFECLFMVLNLALQEGLSYRAIGSVLKFINQLFGQDVIPDSIKVFRALFGCDLGMSYHFYCPKCKCYLGSHSALSKEGSKFVCPECKRPGTLSDMNEGNFFIIIPLLSQLKLYLENKKNVKELLAYRFKRLKSCNTMTDVYDGELYKALSAEGEILSNVNNLSLTSGTDGSPVFTSVANSMWPIQSFINELPPNERFESENIFVSGVWFGKEEPVMNVFLSMYVLEAQALYKDGFEWSCNGELIRSRVVTLNFAVDSRAKPELQCFKQLHSYDGCGYCFHSGDLVALKRNEKVLRADCHAEEDISLEEHAESESEVEESGEEAVEDRQQPLQQPRRKKKRVVKAVRFCMSSGIFPVRTDEEMREDMRRCEEDGKVHRGVKGKSVVSLLPKFDTVQGFVIDYMHGILLGVTRSMLRLWLESKFSKKPYSIRHRLQEIDAVLLNLKPPNNISRRPRSLADYTHYKANELRAWLFFYSLPCLSGILPDVYYKHYSLLVCAMAILCSLEDLDKTERYLIPFVNDFELLYGPAFMVHNVHITSHVALTCRFSGPLWTHSTFSFETGNGMLVNLVKGTIGVMSQIAAKYMTLRCMPLYANHFSISEPVSKYCETLVPKRRCKSAYKCSGITLLGSAGVAPLSAQQIKALNESNLPCEVSCFYRMIIRSVVYHSLNFPKQGKRSYDSAVKTKCGNFAVIEKFFVVSKQIYVILRCINIDPNSSIAKHDYSGAKCTHIKVCALYPFGGLRVVRAAEIMSKCVFL